MVYDEFRMRSFLKKLTNEELYDSEYLLGVNFDKASMESIIASLVSLYDNVSLLKVKIEGNNSVSSIAVEDFKRKQKVLIKIMDDNRLYAAIMRYKIAERKNKEKAIVHKLVQSQNN